MTTDRRSFLSGLMATLALPTVPTLLAQTSISPAMPVSRPYQGSMTIKVGKARSYGFYVQVGANTPPQNLIAALLKNAGPDKSLDIKSKDIAAPESFTAEALPADKHANQPAFHITATDHGQSFNGIVRFNKNNVVDQIDATLKTETGHVRIKVEMEGYELKPLTYDTSVAPYTNHDSEFRLSDLKKLFHHSKPAPDQ